MIYEFEGSSYISNESIISITGSIKSVSKQVTRDVQWLIRQSVCYTIDCRPKMVGTLLGHKRDGVIMQVWL